MNELECRLIVEPGIEFRAATDDSGGLGSLHGVAVRWGDLSSHLWSDYATGKSVRERFERGAFLPALADGADPRCLVNHDGRMLVGRLTSGTLRVNETDIGLEYDVDVPNTTVGRDLVELVRRGDLSGSSFSFRVMKDGQQWDEESDKVIRTIRRVAEINDVGPVTFPAYETSSIAIAQRSLEGFRARRSASGGDPRRVRADLISRGML